jgi:hypothetical protein
MSIPAQSTISASQRERSADGMVGGMRVVVSDLKIPSPNQT